MPTAGWTRVRGLVDRISSVTGLWFGRRRSLTRRPRPAARRWREVVRGRLVVGGVVVVIWALGIEARLFYLQVLNHDELTARAEGQQSRSIDAHPKRGEILDRNGRMLAYSVDGDAIYAVPSEIKDAVGTATRLCEALDCSDATRQTLEGRLKKTSRAFEWVQRQVAPDAAQRVALLLHIERNPLYFVSYGDDYKARTPGEVRDIEERRRREAEHAGAVESLMGRLSRGELPEEMTPLETNLLGHLRGFAVFGDDYTRGSVARELLQPVAGASRDLQRLSFELLVGAGVLAQDEPMELERADIPRTFSSGALEEAASIDLESVIAQPLRTDLTHLEMFTIDEGSPTTR